MGFRIGVGPRLFRVSVGSRGVRASSGLGPFSASLGGRRRRPHRRRSRGNTGFFGAVVLAVVYVCAGAVLLCWFLLKGAALLGLWSWRTIASRRDRIDGRPSTGGLAPAAWYADPDGTSGRRWWNGSRWTDQTLPAVDQPRIEAAVPVPVPVPSPVAVRVPAPVPVLPAPQPLVSPVASSSPAGAVVWLSASGRVPVVGESHYQPALRHAARGGTAGPGHQLIPARAVLVAEPRNAHDSNAVRVDLLDRDDQAVTVGYLARDVARRYQPVLNRIGGRTAVCPARITGGGAKFYGVYLHLGRPSALLLSNVPPDGVDPIDADRPVSVTGEEEHQAELSGRGAQPGAPVHVAVTFGSCVIARGKYAGHSGIEVRLDGRRIGQFTYAMSERYRAQLIPPVANVWAEAILTATPDRGLQVEVLLPAVS